LLVGEGETSVTPVAFTEGFDFHCHAGVSCFTECCRELELALTPYDVVRLRMALGQSSQEFIDEYAVIEFTAEDLSPKVYLAMVDDGRASCPFVTPTGCRVYDDRPAACRTYPLARGASLPHNHEVQEQFVIIHEAHCLGFAEPRSQSVMAWLQEQDLDVYNHCNDLILPLLMASPGGQTKIRLTAAQAALFVDTLYGLDRLQTRLLATASPDAPAVPADTKAILTLAVNWLTEQWRTAS
jgi:hypothetical protein